MVEITGIPHVNNENPFNIVANIMKLINDENDDDQTDSSSIDVAHRLAGKENAPIIVKFKDRSSRPFYL